MGQGIDLARADAPEHAAALDNMKDQLLLVLLQRLGGDVVVPVKEIDDTGGLLGSLQLVRNDTAFRFTVTKKS